MNTPDTEAILGRATHAVVDLVEAGGVSGYDAGLRLA